MRKLAGYVTAILLGGALLGGAAAGQTPTLEERVCALEAEVGIGPCSEPSTTTTTAGTTTTTAAPTITTTASTTTTTQPPGDEVLGLANGRSSYDIELSNADNGDHWWVAPYKAFLSSTAGWVEGDRIGYACGYGPLIDNGHIVGRFTFARVEGAAYAKVNDRFMQEGLRFYDGSKTPEGTVQAYGVEFCRGVVAQEYEPNLEPDSNPVIEFHHLGRVVEVRDYADVTRLIPNLKFRLTGVSGPLESCDGEGRCVMVNQRATVIAYVDDLPVIVVYYDALNGGSVTASE